MTFEAMGRAAILAGPKEMPPSVAAGPDGPRSISA